MNCFARRVELLDLPKAEVAGELDTVPPLLDRPFKGEIA